LAERTKEELHGLEQALKLLTGEKVTAHDEVRNIKVTGVVVSPDITGRKEYCIAYKRTAGDGIDVTDLPEKDVQRIKVSKDEVLILVNWSLDTAVYKHGNLRATPLDIMLRKQGL